MLNVQFSKRGKKGTEKKREGEIEKEREREAKKQESMTHAGERKNNQQKLSLDRRSGVGLTK